MKTLVRVNFILVMIVWNLSVTTSDVHAQINLSSENQKLDDFITRYHELDRFNGVILVARKGEKILSKGYGSANIEFQVPNSPDNKYMLASVSKTFTATIVMKLIDQGKLSLDTKLSEILPWYRQDIGNKVTIFQLLNHTSGIPNYMDLSKQTIPELNRLFGTTVIDKEEFAKKYCMYDLEFEPGSKWKYNNTAYFLLALIVEQVTGNPFHVMLNQMIFEPLNMTNSGDLQPDPEKVVDKLATGYLKDGNGFRKMQYWNLSTALGAGSIYSTLDDLLKYDQAFYSDTFVSAKAKQAMFTPGLNGYGCGWELREMPLGTNAEIIKVQTHEGYLWGWHTRLFRLPGDSLFIMLISNTGDTPIEKLFTGITDIHYGRKPVFPRPSLSLAIENLITEHGLDEAIQYGKLQLAMHPGNWEISESDLNRVGYKLMMEGLNTDAVKIFKFNTEIFPDNWNVWDSYGEGLAVIGNKQAAIDAYQKSIELNSQNKSGLEALKKLQTL